MLFLAIETSSVQGSLALVRDGTILREALFGKGLTYVRDIAELVHRALRAEGLTARALEGIAVSVGPGSYTGVRVGVTAAKTLGFALEIPVVGVESMRVLAANVALATPSQLPSLRDRPSEGILVAPVLDGRQRFLYGSLFDVGRGAAGPQAVRQLLPQSVDRAGELCRAICLKVEEHGTSVPTLVIGHGAVAFLAIAESSGSRVRFEPGAEELATPRARGVGWLAAPDLSAACWDPEAVHRLEPLYLRVTEAERRLMEAKEK